jgi:hypothetical protein
MRRKLYEVCYQSSEINFVVRELANLRLRDHYEMIATSLLYLQSKFELASLNTCGSVVVRVDICLLTASQKWRIITASNFMQSSIVSS